MVAYNSAALYDSSAVYGGVTHATKPVFTVKLTTFSPGAAPSYTTGLEAYVQHTSIRMGRGSTSFGAYNPGQAVFDCVSNTTDPTSSFVPLKHIVLICTHGSHARPVYVGLIDTIRSEVGAGSVAGRYLYRFTVTCSDMLKVVAQLKGWGVEPTPRQPAPAAVGV